MPQALASGRQGLRVGPKYVAHQATATIAGICLDKLGTIKGQKPAKLKTEKKRGALLTPAHQPLPIATGRRLYQSAM